MFDCAVIGGGPAGISAVLNLKIRQKRFIWFAAQGGSDKVRLAERVDNYPGLSSISGEAFARALEDQITAMGIEKNPSMVTQILPMGDYYAIIAQSDYFEAKTVILATGTSPARLIEGEKDLLGRGVSYCATCDGALYRGKTVAVLATSPRFAHEVEFLSSLAETVLFYPYYKDATDMGKNVIRQNAKIARLLGEGRLNVLELSDGSTQPVDGIFILRDSIAPTSLIEGIDLDGSHFKVNRQMKTSLPGVFAAGDCTGTPYQYAKAVGEGNIAAHSAMEYLRNEGNDGGAS